MEKKPMVIRCKMTGKETELPCSASGCPLFGDCFTRYEKYAKKPMTNADRIRAMSDRELASFLAGKFTDHETTKAVQKGEMPTATYISQMAYTWFSVWMTWLQQPAEVDNGKSNDQK